MNKFVLTSCLGFVGLNPLAHGQAAQEPPGFYTDTVTGLNVSWSSVSGRTYFLQCSLDLSLWIYDSVIYSGDGDIADVPVPGGSGGPRFYRLQFTDLPVDEEGPAATDFDGDGIDSGDEISSDPQTNPLDADTDGDGLADNWELAAGSEPTVAPAPITPGATGLSVHSPLRHPLALRPAAP